MKQIKLLLFSAIFGIAFLGNNVNAQAVGDYGSAATNNAWNTASNWVVCVTNGTWDGATIATTGPTSLINIWIRNGHVITLPSSGNMLCNNLTVENGGKVIAASTKYSPRYIRVYGSTVTVNGECGVVDNGLGIQLYAGTGTQVLTFTGSGSTYLNRLTPFGSAGEVIFDTNVTLHYPGATGTGSSGLYGAAGFDFTFTINAGKTVTMADNSYITMGAASGVTAGTSNLTMNINGTLTMAGANSILNLNTGVASSITKTVNVNVGSTGVINANGPVRAWYTNTGIVNFNVAAGGVINATATSAWHTPKANLNINGTINASGIVNDSIGVTSISSTGALNFNKVKGKIVARGNTLVSGTLSLGADTLKLGNYNLVVASTSALSRTTGFVVTDGTGKLTLPVSAGVATLFPIGTSETSYDPATLTPASASDIAVKVSTILSGSAVNCTLNQKEWDITPAFASSTEIKLTPSTISASGLDPIIGHYEGSAYKHKIAVFDGTSYTSTFNTFSPFVTGSSDVISAINNGVSAPLIVSMTDGSAYLNGTTQGQKIQVYTLNGQLVRSLVATSSHTQLQLIHGVYLIKTNNESLKVVL